MSFTSEVKEELVHVERVCSHCQRALLAALVRTEGHLYLSGKGLYRIEISTDSPSVARLCIHLLHEEYRLETQLTIRRSVLHNTPNYLIEVPKQPKLLEALRDMGILSASGGLESGIREEVVRKECCAAAFLRGAFLGSGFISDPRGNFHFEMNVESEDFAFALASLMERKDIHAKTSSRRNAYMVYLKNGGSILEFLAYTGAHRNALAFENERVLKSVRNEVNRYTNAEMANQLKAVNASFDQALAIHAVMEHYGLEGLPPALREVVLLRAKNPRTSLKELGELANPPLSKSAINHRIRRIEQMAAELKKEKQDER